MGNYDITKVSILANLTPKDTSRPFKFTTERIWDIRCLTVSRSTDISNFDPDIRIAGQHSESFALGSRRKTLL